MSRPKTFDAERPGEAPLLLKADEVAKMLGLGRTKVYEMMASGKLPVVRIGTAVRVRGVLQPIRQKVLHRLPLDSHGQPKLLLPQNLFQLLLHLTTGFTIHVLANPLSVAVSDVHDTSEAAILAFVNAPFTPPTPTFLRLLFPRFHDFSLPPGQARQTVACRPMTCAKRLRRSLRVLPNPLEQPLARKPRLRPKSFVSYKQLTEQHLVPTIGKIELAKLTPQDVQELLNEIVKKGLSARTAQYVRAVLRRALNQALKWGLVARNVAALVDPPRIVRHEVQPFAVEEIKELLGLFEQNRLGALYLLALTHGLRQGEALGLRWEDVDLKKKELRVRQTLQWVDGEWQFVEPKTKQSRRGFALTEQIVKALRKHRKVQLEERLLAGGDWKEYGLVFTTRSGKPLDGVNVTRDFKRLLKRGKLPMRRFHDLRHTTASLLLYQKVHPRVVMDLLGHSEIRVTMDLYSHVAPVLQREAADEMDALLKTVKARRK